MRRTPSLTLALCAALCSAAPAVAQEISPRCATPARSAFDFWIGEWEVHTADGSFAGHNTISRMADGCGLTENWRGNGGSRGGSLNFFDPTDGRWHQIWIDNTGLILRLAGGPDTGGMTLSGTGLDTTRLQRISWTPLEDGRVRQHWERSDDRGESWTTVFNGYYSRLPESDTVTWSIPDLRAGLPACAPMAGVFESRAELDGAIQSGVGCRRHPLQQAAGRSGAAAFAVEAIGGFAGSAVGLGAVMLLGRNDCGEDLHCSLPHATCCTQPCGSCEPRRISSW